MPENGDGWKCEHEEILVSWCDTAQCYRWLCYSSHEKYSRLQYSFSIPTIILSTIIGAASFTTIAVSSDFQKYMPLIVGTINILIGILNTLQQYFKISEYNENFRICALAWAKFARNIEFELSKPPEDRNTVTPFIRKACEDLERLMETTPIFPKEIVYYLTKKLDEPQYLNVKKPPILSGIYASNNFRHLWYKIELDTNKESFILENTKVIEDSINENGSKNENEPKNENVSIKAADT
jgi:hypothetical protein